MSTSIKLENRVAVVTGGSRGLGRAVAERLAEAGCQVVIGYTSSDEEAQATVRGLSGVTGSAFAVKGDLRDPAAAQHLVQSAFDTFGQLDYLIHNAASFRPMPALAADLTAVHEELALAINPLLATAPMLAKLMGEGGRVIAISSNGARQVVPAYLSVGLAKAALENLARYLATELAGSSIAVNVIATALLDKGDPHGIAASELGTMLARRCPAGRLSTPADVADAVLLLCAPEAGWIHGQVITVDGGLGLLA